MLDRRRALMAQNNGVDTSILYELENRYVTGGNIATTIPIVSTDQDFSVAFDMTLETDPVSGDASQYRLIRVIDETNMNYSLAVFKNPERNIIFRYMSSQVTLESSGPGRRRFVVTHEKSSGSAAIKWRGGTVITKTVTSQFTASTKYLVLGQTSGVNQLPRGTINKIIVYSRVLKSAEIDAFLGL